MNWTAYRRVTAPASPLLDLDLVKAHLRVDHDDDDDLIAGLIEAVTAYIEGPTGIGIALVDQTWRLTLDGFQPWPKIELGPVKSITSITYRDASGQTQTLDPSSYMVDLDDSPSPLFPPQAVCFPSTDCRPGSVKITFEAGYGDPADVPADIRQAALLMIGHWYKHREDTTETTVREIPTGAERVLAKYRVG